MKEHYQEKVDELAQEYFNKEFYELPPDIQDDLYSEAVDIVKDMSVGEVANL